MKFLLLFITTLLIADQSYEDGLKFLREDKRQEAFESFSKSSSIESKHELGTMYLNGIYVNQDYEKAFELFMLGVEKEYSLSLNNAGLMLKNGLVKKDREKGCFYLKKAAERDLTQGVFNYGLCLYEDDKIKESFNLFNHAAGKGSIPAIEYLARILENGAPGIEKNRKLAIMLYVKSANEGGYGVSRLSELKRKCYLKRDEGCDILDRLTYLN